MAEVADNTQDDRTVHPQRILVLRDFCTRFRGSACDRCARACPHGAIEFNSEELPVIDAQTCTNCGICLGICDAFTSTRVTMIDLHARVRRIALRGEDVVITCKENIFPGFQPAANVVVLPCLATLSPEFWTLVLAENIPVSIAGDLAYCADCDRAGEFGEMLFTHAIATAEQWTGRKVGYLETIPEKENLVKDLANPEGVDRRSAFTNLAADVADVASGKRRLRNSDVLQQFYERKERARARARLNLNESPQFNDFAPEGHTKQTMHPKRRMLLEAIDREPAIAPNVPVVISRTDRALCTNALDCAAVCPTGARYPDPADGTLAFDARYCIGCGLCVSACAQGAVRLIEESAEVFLTEEAGCEQASKTCGTPQR